MILFLGFLGCQKVNTIKDINIIPKPVELNIGIGNFELSENTRLLVGSFEVLQNRFVEEIKKETGFQLKLTDKVQNNCIEIQFVENLLEEEYQLIVKKQGITIKSSTSAGAYYALQTIKQLIPVNSNNNNKYLIPSVEILDKPAFAWRGYMLDVSRHFFGKEKIKEALDFMAELKLNRFHWHLTDDQGWRIEIKKYPKLTQVGAKRVDYTITDESLNDWWGRPFQKEGEKATYGGFYTQEDIKEIIAYAKERHIEILPEIDVPGHSQAILAAYPEISCDPKRKFYVATGGVLGDNALCASNPKTYTFLEDVLAEVIDLFPLDYIHIGGDECNKSGWKHHEDCQRFIKEKGLGNEHELQSFLIKQVEKMLNNKGKNMIGWNEILEGGLAPNATVMSWQGEKGGIVAAKAGHNVIMTPMEYNYLDLKQGQSESEPNLGYSEALLSTCYNYKVIPEGVTEAEADRIMGIQGNLWTESIADWSKVTYMTFPRLFAIAENAWTLESLQNFEDFIKRLQPQLRRMDAKGIRYAKSVFNPWIHQKGYGKSIEITLASELHSPEIRYTLDGTDPTESSMLYSVPFTLTETKTIKTAIFKNGKRLGDIIENTFPIHKAAGAKVVYNHPFSKNDEAAKEWALTDLNYGQIEVAGDNNWQGFYDDFDVTIELDNPTDIEEVVINTLRLTIFGIYPPMQIEVFGSTDGNIYKKLGDKDLSKEAVVQGRNRIICRIPCPALGIKKIRVKATLLAPIPIGHHKSGSKSYLKIDELILL